MDINKIIEKAKKENGVFETKCEKCGLRIITNDKSIKLCSECENKAT